MSGSPAESMPASGGSPLGLYLHVPFCAAICNYCNFNRGLFDPALKTRYVEALIGEIAASGSARSTPEREPADSIFFGGGTPSLLEPDDVRRILEVCRRTFDVAAGCEVTLEANPETTTEDRVAAYRDAGVNRISFGVQSFRDEELRRLSRLHSAGRARAAFAEARRAGVENISLDLMMWLPEQRLDEWLCSIDSAVALGPDHLSLYLLELYPGAPLKDEIRRQRWSQAPDEDAEAMYLAALDRLEAAGYRQYEISNVARIGRESRHNLKYWSDGEWLGFGCGAHSTRGGVRWKNVSAADAYIERVASGETLAVDVHRLNPDERLGDALFTGLRRTGGVDIDEVGRRYGVDVWARYGADLEPFVHGGCLTQNGGRLALTRRGMLLANEVMAVFV
jgi:oxygen-independent coproporphyrinogen-3 oxidase